MFSFLHKERRVEVVNLAITICSALGAAAMAYLLKVHFLAGDSSICNFSAAFSCDLVNQSVYSQLLGVPISLLGLIFFLGLIILVQVRRLRTSFVAILMLTSFALTFSLTLSGIEVFVLHSVCVFCEAAKVLMIGIIGLAAYGSGLRGEKPKAVDLLLMAAGGIALGYAVYSSY